jgi:hypothetical protein
MHLSVVKRLIEKKDQNYFWLTKRIIVTRWKEYIESQKKYLRGVLRGVDITLKMEALRKIKEFSRNILLNERIARTKRRFEIAVVKRIKRWSFNHWRTFNAISFYREINKV